MSSEAEAVKLKTELAGLFRYLERVREEIAAISRPADEEMEFGSMGEQLDAIVQATEKATDTIMESTENSLRAVDTLRETLKDPAQTALLDQIVKDGNEILEACSFQDITGQRVSKVVKSVTYVEERVNALIDVWGKDEVDSVEVEGEEKTEDEKLLAGPQLEGKGLDQAAIDALFD